MTKHIEKAQSPLRGSRGRYPWNDRPYLEVYLPLEDLAFGDESGTDGGAKFCVVAGYIGSPRQWMRFDSEWNRILSGEGIEFFHGLEFFQRPSWQSRKSPYYEWTHERGMGFLERLLGVIDYHSILPIGCVVDVDAWGALAENMRAFASGAVVHHKADIERNVYTLNQDITQTSVDKPYLPAFNFLLIDADERARKDALIRVVMDENDSHEGGARSILRSMRSGEGHSKRIADRISGLSFENDCLHPGLQAADLYANVMRTYHTGDLPTSFYEKAYAMVTRKRQSLRLLDADEFQRLTAASDQMVRQKATEMYRLLQGPQTKRSPLK